MRFIFKVFCFSIRGLVKVKALHEQVASMEKIVAQMKVNKEQVQKQVHQLRQRIDQLLNDITVSFQLNKFLNNNLSLEYIYDSYANRYELQRPCFID